MIGQVWIVMGVSGSGKTTLGQMLAQELNLPFYDADNFHPQENVEKMRRGIPLRDEDRIPWLMTLAAEITEWAKAGGAVLACSALKENYRRILRHSQPEKIQFVYLKASFEEIFTRLNNRKGHYFPAELLQSQFDALEEPQDALVFDATLSPKEIVARIIRRVN